MDARTLLARFAAPLALVVAVFALYAQMARHEFVDYDTSVYVTANPRVVTGLTFDNVRWVFTHHQPGYWHPLAWISHMLDIELFGLAPAGHLLENAGWHALNALLVLVLFTRLGLARAFAFAGALLFAIHPLRVEPVAWIVERKELLSTCFGLACLLAWLSFARTHSRWKLAGALALYACSLLSKPMLVTLPCLLLLFEYWPLGNQRTGRRTRLLALCAFAALAMAAALATVGSPSPTGAQGAPVEAPLALRIGNALASYAWYLGSFCWPRDLAFYYPIEPGGPSSASVLIGATLIVVLSAGAWRLRAREPGVLVGWLWFLGTLVPVIGLVSFGAQAHADRFTYFPGLGLVLATMLIAQHELLPRVPARVLAGLGCVIAIALGVQSWRQIATWRNTETLALHALETTRDNNVALDLLGSHYSNSGRVAEALPLLREAVRLSPTDTNALANLGGTLLRHGDLEESEQVLLRATRLTPGFWLVWRMLGGLYVAQRRFDDALAALDRAAALEPDDGASLMNRGLALDALGRLEEARQALERAVQLRGDLWSAELTLGRVYLRLDRPEEARGAFERVLQHDPQHFDALRGLERVELTRGALDAAWSLAQKAASARPESAAVLADEAWILALATDAPLAQPKQALELAEKAIALGGEQPALLDALALAAAANDDFARAQRAAARAIGLLDVAEPAWTARLQQRLAAYGAGRIDRATPR